MFNGVSCYRYHLLVVTKKEKTNRSQPKAEIDPQLSKELRHFDPDFYLDVPSIAVSNADFR